ncbi:MAG: hypothetical protein QOE70_799 [Chthoniobacter sp.]|jgi:predicted RNA-binding Zn-ribbon protein involved in translation (DUF1610 family)|nr:hypothetical protein [Chthoniobacter sp.]
MFGLNWLGCTVLNLLSRFAVHVACPRCGFRFKPFADHTFTRLSEIMGRFPCPKCGHRFAIGEDQKTASEDAKFNPPGPFAQPADSRIERRAPSDRELLFYIPPSGRAGFLLLFSIFWNIFMAPLFFFMVVRGNLGDQTVALGPKVIVSLFFLIGVWLTYFALHERFASHLLYLSPELVRMQRKLVLKSNSDLSPAEILTVKKVTIYTQNDSAVRGIELSAGLRLIRFGSALLEDEKDWLAWEIRNYLRQHGATQLPPEPAQRRPKPAREVAKDEEEELEPRTES